MKTLVIDRFESGFAICEGDDGVMFGIETAEMPQGAKEGDVIDITDDGVVEINVKKTEQRTKMMNDKTSNMFKKNKKKK